MSTCKLAHGALLVCALLLAGPATGLSVTYHFDGFAEEFVDGVSSGPAAPLLLDLTVDWHTLTATIAGLEGAGTLTELGAPLFTGAPELGFTMVADSLSVFTDLFVNTADGLDPLAPPTSELDLALIGLGSEFIDTGTGFSDTTTSYLFSLSQAGSVYVGVEELTVATTVFDFLLDPTGPILEDTHTLTYEFLFELEGTTVHDSAPIPEPSSLLLLSLGTAGWLGRGRVWRRGNCGHDQPR